MRNSLIIPKVIPKSLIWCRILGSNNDTYEKCKRCPEHLECVRWLEKELHEEGIDIATANFSVERWRRRFEKP